MTEPSDRFFSIPEYILIFYILDSYCETEFYRNHYNAAFEQIETQCKTYNQDLRIVPRSKDKAKAYFAQKVDKILNDLYSNTGVRVKLVEVTASMKAPEKKFGIQQNRIREIDGFRLELQARADDLPVEIPESEAPPNTLTLRFDLTRGIEPQIVNANKKLQDRRIQVMLKAGNTILLPAVIGTSRQSLEKVLESLMVMVVRDRMQREVGPQATWKMVSDQLGMPVSTAKKKYQKAKKLVYSHQITSYFPPFE